MSAVNIAASSQNSPEVNLMQELKIGKVASRLGHLRILISIIVGQRTTPGYFFSHPFGLRHTGHSLSCKQQPCICPGGASLHLRRSGFQKSLESSRQRGENPYDSKSKLDTCQRMSLARPSVPGNALVGRKEVPCVSVCCWNKAS